MSSDLRTHNACPTCPGAIRLLPSECLIPNTRELCIVHTFSLWRVIMWFGWSEIDVSFKLTAVVTWPRCNVAWLQVSVCVPVCYGLLGRTTLLCSRDWCVYLLQKIDFSHQFHVAMFSMYVNFFVAISVFFAFSFFKSSPTWKKYCTWCIDFVSNFQNEIHYFISPIVISLINEFGTMSGRCDYRWKCKDSV